VPTGWCTRGGLNLSPSMRKKVKRQRKETIKEALVLDRPYANE
jgi:hypothetical protein